MKKQILVSAFIFFLGSLFAQKKIEQQLMGSWELTKTDSNGFTLPESGLTYYSFYKGGKFQIKTQYPKSDSAGKISETDFGTWNFNDASNTVYISNCYIYGMILTDATFEITLLNDSFLELEYSIQSNKFTRHYKKITTIPKIKDDVKWTAGVPEPDFPKYALVNSLDTAKKVILKETDYISVSIQEPCSDSSIKSENSWTDGQINGLKDSTVSLFADHYKTEIKFQNDSSITISKNNNSGFTQNINLPFVKDISYSNSFRDGLNGFSGGMIFLSGFDLFILAPLVSIKYHNGQLGFNSKRYFNWMGFGLIGLGISIPLNACSYEKTYFITMKNQRHDKKYWYLEKQ